MQDLITAKYLDQSQFESAHDRLNNEQISGDAIRESDAGKKPDDANAKLLILSQIHLIAAVSSWPITTAVILTSLVTAMMQGSTTAVFVSALTLTGFR